MVFGLTYSFLFLTEMRCEQLIYNKLWTADMLTKVACKIGGFRQYLKNKSFITWSQPEIQTLRKQTDLA